MIKNCPIRHENGNCIPAGGFCTANKNICEALLNAYRMGKAQLSKEDTTSDLISRMETVEHLRRVLDATVPITGYDEGYVDGVEFGISTVSTMPTIQPQSTTGQLNDGARSTAQSTDLIDRQQAIDALDCINGVEEVLRSLPSAQPEYEEVTPEEAASEIASGSIMSAWSWLNVIIQLKQMGYAICRKR